MRLGLSQINLTVGDLDGNCQRMIEQMKAARQQGVELLLFPELAVSGYPPEDLLLREDFLRECRTAVEELARHATGLVALVGFPHREGPDLYNGLAVLAEGELAAVYRKMRLPNYGVFDENRYFRPGDHPALIELNGHLIGLSVCEDMWFPDAPIMHEALAGAELIVNLSASPYDQGKPERRREMLATRARDNLCAVAYCNLVGGQDELVFDGGSLLMDHRGRLLAQLPQYEEQLAVADLDLSLVGSARLHDPRYRTLQLDLPVPVLARLKTEPVVSAPAEPPLAQPLSPMAEVYGALVLGVRDYVRKNGFERVLLGLSGGIDSALVAVLAADALGAENLTCVVMPSPYSSAATQSDARAMAQGLRADLRELSIGPVMEAYQTVLAGEFEGLPEDVTEENIQARIRGNLLMALSNKFGWLLLSTGNKSEMSVGYATLYGDMAGGFAVLKDVPKLMVFQLCEWRNQQAETAGQTPPVPWSIVRRPPSAELKEGQQDTDSLPPYSVLDPILERYVEQDQSLEQIAAAGFDPQLVRRVMRMTDLSEYKRRQAPPGIKITARAFGRDRRMPITRRF